MQLSSLVSACGLGQGGNYEVELSSIEYDSRRVTPGSAFFALPGSKSDGRLYIGQAIERGAAAVFYEGDPLPSDSVPLIRTENSRLALSRASAAFYRYPANDLIVIGVTGTDGKSSTVSFLHQLLEALSVPTGFISTVSIQTGETSHSNDLRQSTPEAPDIHRLLREMLDEGKLVAVIESTSHGLSDKTARLFSLNYDGGIFTNIDHEHLEFHGSFEQYLSDKANLFRRLRPISLKKLTRVLERSGSRVRPEFLPSVQPLAVINKDDEQFEYLEAVARNQGARVRAFSVHEDTACQAGDLITAGQILSKADSSLFDLCVDGEMRGRPGIPIPGIFSIENVLACVGILHDLFGFSPEALAEHIEHLRAVPGRMLSITHGQNFDVIIDYAHTPGSFRKLFPMLRRSCQRRLIAVFGSAGERDIEKRPIQGAIAAEYADVIILTDEDPRREDSMDIIDDIARGAEESDCVIHKIPDRRRAIEKAVSIAEKGDMLVTLGKGHEASIIIAEEKLPWDEEAELRTAIERLGNRRIR